MDCRARVADFLFDLGSRRGTANLVSIFQAAVFAQELRNGGSGKWAQDIDAIARDD